MRTQHLLVVSVGLLVSLSACKSGDSSDGKPSDAVETNVFRDDCTDGGACEGGAGTTADPAPTCKTAADCTKKQNCSPKGYCISTGSAESLTGSP